MKSNPEVVINVIKTMFTQIKELAFNEEIDQSDKGFLKGTPSPSLSARLCHS